MIDLLINFHVYCNTFRLLTINKKHNKRTHTLIHAIYGRAILYCDYITIVDCHRKSIKFVVQQPHSKKTQKMSEFLSVEYCGYIVTLLLELLWIIC